MPPMISKPDSPSGSQLEKESDSVYIDPDLAHIISTVVSSIKSNQIKLQNLHQRSPGPVHFHALSVARM